MDNKKLNLTECFNRLEKQINELSHLLLTQSKFTANVFRLPEILKGDETNEISSIYVEKITGKEALNDVVQLINLLFIHKKSELVSNKSAIRLPGVVCVETSPADYQQFETLITQINSLKSEIKKIVTDVDELQRFEFIRESLHGLLTLNTYRTLTLLSDVDTIRFGWANKKVINKITKEEILNRLQDSFENGRGPRDISKEQWQAQLTNEIALIHSLPHDAILKTQRPVKVQPIARVWNKEQQKQTQFACAMPLFVFAVNKELSDIIIGDLPDYYVDNIVLRNRPKSKPVELIIPRLNLYIER